MNELLPTTDCAESLIGFQPLSVTNADTQVLKKKDWELKDLPNPLIINHMGVIFQMHRIQNQQLFIVLR